MDEQRGSQRRGMLRRKEDRERCDALETVTEELERKRWRDRLAVPALALALVLILIAAVLSTTILVQQRGLEDAQDKLEVANHRTDRLIAELRKEQRERRNAEIKQCRRVQGLRDDLNHANGIIYAALGTIEVGVRSADRSGDSPPSRAALYKEYGLSVKFHPPTNCKKATDSPLDYQPPKPIPYEKYVKNGGNPPVPLPPSNP